MVDGEFAPGFALRLAYKDIGLALDAAREHDLKLPITEALALRWEQAIANGHADEDLAAVTSRNHRGEVLVGVAIGDRLLPARREAPR